MAASSGYLHKHCSRQDWIHLKRSEAVNLGPHILGATDKVYCIIMHKPKLLKTIWRNSLLDFHFDQIVIALECETGILLSTYSSGYLNICITWTDNMLWPGRIMEWEVSYSWISIFGICRQHDLRIKALNMSSMIFVSRLSCHKIYTYIKFPLIKFV